MTPYLALGILFVYFFILILISIKTSKGADSNSFFTANKSVPWWLVAFGMIGTSISGVTFVSVPGAVGTKFFSYFQMVLGFTAGYVFIGTVLMPLYYRLNLISIYGYLKTRFGFWSYKTGSAFFLLSRTLGSAVRLFIAAKVLQIAIYDPLGVPFELSVIFTIALIWVYTFKGGIKTIVITDTLQTFFLITAVAMTIYLIAKQLNLGFGEMLGQVYSSPLSETFFFDGGWGDAKNFFKLFISGAFIAIVMTGLDQDLMQKNLTCKNIKEAQKNMFWFTVTLVIVNLMFLSLGALLYMYASQKGIQTPTNTDDLYPMMALKVFSDPSFGLAGILVGVTFLIGITAATYASSDSALTALTTAFSIDFMDVENKPEAERIKIKNRVHIGFSVIFVIVILIFNVLNNSDVISAVYKIASYTYGPLLGLFSYGIYTKRNVIDKYVPFICIASPILTYYSVILIEKYTGYIFGFENLLLNGLITIIGLMIFRKK
ncbi:sodium:solute symporter [Lacihabitans sp. CS3-21]|jgi:Na+/proline symporter|uniref:sodium:solute symporter n=1 Tax=Lacihabitans sp. CS3-21 TaxID=2487332 RepID=UPI0020CCB4BF|nr:sodium:solute symporter [Lacihabitans sp. CS3-21]MCP9747396.1 sodium:solute symporter [Lacihabitans sp. CS3-21]